MRFKNPRAELISHTMFPVETVYCIWQQSKENDFTMTPKEVNEKMKIYDTFSAEVYDTFKRIMKQQIPTNENISFTFMLHDLPISLREQMVRHRIGSKMGDNYGVDVIPEVQSSSFWSQSMRILDFGNFFDTQKYFTPLTIRENAAADSKYSVLMNNIQDVYNYLVNECGIPMEDARNVLPLGSTMGITWTLNLASLLHIIGKRSCWILQYGLWSFLIKDMINELSKVDSVFGDLILPPCFSNGKYETCKFKHENERRLDGRDELPLCSLYYEKEIDETVAMNYSDNYPDMSERMLQMADKYSELWGVNAFTGKKGE